MKSWWRNQVMCMGVAGIGNDGEMRAGGDINPGNHR